jgi:hypothetical protein
VSTVSAPNQRSSRYLVCIAVEIDASQSATEARRALRHALEGAKQGDFVRITVPRNALPFDFADLVPAYVRVQIVGHSGYDAHDWLAALESAR